MEKDFVKICLPKLGESIVSASIVQWFKKVGDFVAKDEPLLEVSTDKVNSEIPAPQEGVLQEILAAVGEERPVGAELAILASKTQADPVHLQMIEESRPVSSCENEGLLSPAVLRLLQEKKIALSEISKMARTGQNGRLSKKDVENYLEKSQTTKDLPKQKKEIECVKMTAMRKAIADNMVKSFYEAPHASLVSEVDVTKIVAFIAEKKEEFFKEHGVKLSITAFVALAIAAALVKYPLLNSSVQSDTLLVKKFVNIGVAVSVYSNNLKHREFGKEAAQIFCTGASSLAARQGASEDKKFAAEPTQPKTDGSSCLGIDQGVMVPVIRNVQDLTLSEVAKQIATLADKARSGKLASQDVQEGTITMTNFGMAGAWIGIPIIRYPEVAIVGLGAIVKKVVAMKDDSIAIRSMMMISLTFDHRALDGLYGCGFLAELKQQLEENLLKIVQ